MQYLVLIMYVHHTQNKGFHVCKKDFIICLLVHQVWQLQGGYQKPGAVYTTRKTRIKKYYLKAVYDSYKKTAIYSCSTRRDKQIYKFIRSCK